MVSCTPFSALFQWGDWKGWNDEQSDPNYNGNALETIKVLVAAKADPALPTRYYDPHGKEAEVYPLFLAVKLQNIELVKALLDAGAYKHESKNESSTLKLAMSVSVENQDPDTQKQLTAQRDAIVELLKASGMKLRDDEVERRPMTGFLARPATQ